MTTRAGFIGMLTGLLASVIAHLVFWVGIDVRINGHADLPNIFGAISLMVLVAAGGWLAARKSLSTEPIRCSLLGALAGGLAGTMVFCLWGAAASGWFYTVPAEDEAASILPIVVNTQKVFLVLFISGCLAGAVGGWFGYPRQRRKEDVFNKDDPQMAMNASITAVAATIVTTGMAAVIYTNLAKNLDVLTEVGDPESVMVFPLRISLLLVLISQLALTLVVPHETRQSEHRCGMLEVRMAAWVGMAAAPFLILLLVIINSGIFNNPTILVTLVISIGLSLACGYIYFRKVLPRLASFPRPAEDRKQKEADLFGTIAVSRGSRLVILCIGCGLLMVLPVYVVNLSVLINLANPSIGPGSNPDQIVRLFLLQALGGMGVAVTTATLLSLMYIFYFNLGRWYSKRKTRVVS